MKISSYVFLFLLSLNYFLFSQSISLLLPNGGEMWQSNRTPKIQWSSENVSTIRIDISYNDGVDWENISPQWPASIGEYQWFVPDSNSNSCRVKITDTSNDAITDESDGKFTITDHANSIYIVVLGSSTAAGTGPSSSDSAWVNRYRKYIQQRNTAANIMNLAVGGYTTYHILPDGFAIPTNRPSPSIGHNITKALEFSPIAIIINLPSNDAANRYSVSEQIANYRVVMEKADSANVPVWIATTQPRNLDSLQRKSLMDMRDSTYSIWGEYAIDFWTNIADNNGRIIQIYNSGDGVHLNDAGHRILYNRVVDANIPLVTTSNKDAFAAVPTEFSLEQNYPNPFNPSTTIQYYLKESGIVKLKVYNALGQEVSIIVDSMENAGLHQAVFNAGNLSSGNYFYTLQIGTYVETKKMMLLK